MRRHAFPYKKYRIDTQNLAELGLEVKHFIEHQGFSIIKFDEKNENVGTLVIGVNKTILQLLKQKKPMGHLQEFFFELTSLFSVDVVPLRDVDENSQRVGIEIYLWPLKNNILMEVFVLPYSESMNKADIHHLISHPEEELTDWYLCEEIWEQIEPEIKKQFNTKPITKR